MGSGSQSWRELSFGAKLFISLVVVAGTCVLLYGALRPTSKNIAQFICYLLIAILAARLKVRLPGITGTMSVNFLFILLGILELGFAETLALATAAILVQCFYRDRPSPLQVTFNLSASAMSIAIAYNVYHLAISRAQVKSSLAAGIGGSHVFRGQHGIDRRRDRAHRAQVDPAHLGGMLFLVVSLLPGGRRLRGHDRVVQPRVRMGDLAAHRAHHLPDLPVLSAVPGKT